MKRYVIVLMVILALTPVLLVGCAQETGVENRIVSLSSRLTIAESTIKTLQGRIEQLEKESLTEEDILGALEGKTFLAVIYGIPRYGYVTTGIKIEYFSDTD